MKKQNLLSRRKALEKMLVGTAALSIPGLVWGLENRMRTNAIPSSNEKLGGVGLGTWQTFDVGSSASARAQLKEVLSTLISAGGSLVDSSPMYGSSEQVVGDLTSDLAIQEQLFYATKVWTSGEASGKSQMNRSIARMTKSGMDLMQVHNLVDWKTHLKTLYDWKESGKIRYVGITHYLDSAHSRMSQIIKDEKLDFIQVNCSMAERNAERELLKVAMDHGVAVITNRPYAGGSLFRRTKGKALPPWALEFDCESWGQFFLKYLLSNPAVTSVIPGTSKPHHMKDNVGAGFGRLPNEQERRKMLKLIQDL